MPLNYEEAEVLVELLQHPGFPLLKRELAACAELMEQDVIKFHCEPESASRLFLLKARAEGARTLLFKLETHFAALKKSAL